MINYDRRYIRSYPKVGEILYAVQAEGRPGELEFLCSTQSNFEFTPEAAMREGHETRWDGYSSEEYAEGEIEDTNDDNDYPVYEVKRIR